MKQYKLILCTSVLTALVFMLSVLGCKKDKDDEIINPGGGKIVHVTVVDENNNPVPGAVVKCKTATATTSGDGVADLTGAVENNGKYNIVVEAGNYFNGYMNITKSEGEEYTTVKLIKKEMLGNITSGSASTLTGDNFRYMSNGVSFKAEDGSAASGSITVYARYIGADQMDRLSETMPGGDFAAVNETGSEGTLESYGFTAFEFKDQSGKKVVPASNAAQVAITLPQEALTWVSTNGANTWFFNDKSYSWSYGGAATVNGGEVYMPVSASSFGNCDKMNAKAKIKGKLECDGEPAKGIKVTLRGAYGYAMQYTTRTNANGAFLVEVGVPSGGGEYTITAGNFTGKVMVTAGQINDVGTVKICDAIQGAAGDPRFNLQFTNSENVDLDLHVLTPNGNEISYSNSSDDGGQLDIDCACSACPNGANENIFWQTGMKGTYKFWVEYFEDCKTGEPSGASSTFTLRRMRNNVIEQTYTGTLSTGKSDVYTFTF